MATIEPRLIHLLNDTQPSYLPANELPPLQSLSYSKPLANSVTLPSLDLGLELHPRGERADRGDLQNAAKFPPASQQNPQVQKIPSFSILTGEDIPFRLAPPQQQRQQQQQQQQQKQHQKQNRDSHKYDGSERLKKANHSLRVLLDDSDSVEYSHSLRMILDDPSPEPPTEDASTKKRQRALTVKDDLIQLPQPLKKQKSVPQVVPHMPPIINGLHEPPPNVALFPPISAVDFGDGGEPPNLPPIKEYNSNQEDTRSGGAPVTPVEDKLAAAPVKAKRRATKPRRKWTDVETNHLLLGVSRHGVGKWTTILEDPDFRFNERTAGDLKDRFRTCCPDELRATSGNHGGAKLPLEGQATSSATGSSAYQAPASDIADLKPKAKRSFVLENLLITPEEPHGDAAPRHGLPSSQPQDQPEPQADDYLMPKQRKSRAHRKKLEDLAELGIRGPFKKSHRRERRPFTEQDDKDILAGINKYGPAWTRIQRDASFNLSSRQPTDLRDRVRNKYPDIYSRIEKGSLVIKAEPTTLPWNTTARNTTGLLEPIVNTTIEQPLKHAAKPGSPPEPPLSRTGSKENILKLPLHSATILETGDVTHGEPSLSLSQGSLGEMGISRLLLDDTRGGYRD